MSLIKLSGNPSGTGNFTLASPNSNTDRTLTLPDATGTVNVSGLANEVPAGSAGAPAIYPTGDSNTGIFFPAADTIAFAEGGAEAARFDSSGNFGIGTSSVTAGAKVDIRGPLLIKETSGGDIFLRSSVDGSNTPAIQVSTSSPLAFYTSNTERARIDSSGNLLVGITSSLVGNTHSFVNAGSTQFALRNSNATAGRFWQVGMESSSTFLVYNNNNTGVYLTYGGTSWTANSDERMKTTLVPFEDAVDKVCSLRSGTGRYLTDEENVSRSFLIAQDVQAVLPEAVDVKEDEQGTLGLRYTDVVPLLVAAIKEQQATITALEARITALEAN
jgi:hypothetical protein